MCVDCRHLGLVPTETEVDYYGVVDFTNFVEQILVGMC